MITPRFKLNQTDNTITINIRAPYSNLRNLDISAEDDVFIFYCSPYHLRLNLPGRIIDNDFSTSSFDTDKGEFTFTFEKAIPGEQFSDLDMITKLLSPKVEVSSENEPQIIVLDTNETPDKNNLKKEDLDQEFGFAMNGKQNFQHISAEFQDVFDIDPRECDLKERRKLRLQQEQTKFNIDHYISDFIENTEILELMNLKSPWGILKQDQIEFTDQELDFLKDLTNVEYNLSDIQIKYCHCSLVDILFSYCYDRRTTFFEGSSESGWNIVKICASFSWLDTFEDPKSAIISGFRRSLIFPLYRNFSLCQSIFYDLQQLLKLGEKYIIKCLIEMYNIFLQGDSCRYILNNLFIKDYIIYIMKWDKVKWKEIVDEVDKIVIKKCDLGLNLGEIEEDIYGNLSMMSCLTIYNNDSDDTESNSTSDGEESSSSNDAQN